MDFGRVPENELKQVNFSLPPLPAMNKTVLKGKKEQEVEVFIGCAKW